MDVQFFLSERINFIRRFYDVASCPFLEIQRKIKAEEDPFIPSYSEDDEPPFLTEWIEADESLQVIGYSCLSMLNAAVQLYLQTWTRLLGGDPHNIRQKRGWLSGFRAYFSCEFGIEFEASKSNLGLLEEIALARNRTQHPDSITSITSVYSKADLKKLPHAFFVSETERAMLSHTEDLEIQWLFQPSVHITRDKLVAAVEEVEKFAGWLGSTIRESQSSDQ